MVRPRRTHAERRAETRARLLVAAREAFVRDGYAATSMDALCAAAGLTRGALYHNFGGKEGLFEAVVREIDAEIAERLMALPAESDAWRAFRAGCQAYLREALDPEVRQVVLRDAPAVLGQHLRDLDAEGSIAPLTEALRALMEAGRIRTADAETLARLLNGAMLDAALWIAAEPDTDAALARASAALDVLLDGLQV
ncbi:MAG: helix-turn-helix domain-containing protein [Bacteroidota bacterium]